EMPGIDIRNTRAWEALFAANDDPLVRSHPSLVGAFVDPDLIEMADGTVVCAFGVRISEKLCWADPSHPLNGNYLAFSLDQGSTWSHIIQLTSGIMTTHYMAVREVAPNELCAAYDLGAWNKPGRQACTVNVAVERT
ncbi:unnamed protein product, partial [marine sediment metagenome]